MPRVTSANLASLPLKHHADADLDLFIGHGNEFVNQNLVGVPSEKPHTETELTALELYIAAHFASGSLPALSNASMGQQSIGLRGNEVGGGQAKGFASTKWGEIAIAMDRSGVLAALAAGKGQKPFMVLGISNMPAAS